MAYQDVAVRTLSSAHAVQEILDVIRSKIVGSGNAGLGVDDL